MFWRFFVKDVPLLDSALEGIVFKEGKGRFYGRFRKKRLLAYDEVAKCLRYYTPERALKGTIYLHDIFIVICFFLSFFLFPMIQLASALISFNLRLYILFITPGRSSGRDVRKDSVFEITIPGRVCIFVLMLIKHLVDHCKMCFM